MSAEEDMVNAIAEDEENAEEAGFSSVNSPFIRRHEMLQRNNRTTIDDFLGSGQRANAVTIVPRYYGQLLAWALQRYLENDGWKSLKTLRYRGPEPGYVNVSTDCNKSENLLNDGQLLIKKGKLRCVVTLDINFQWGNSMLVEGLASNKSEWDKFILGVRAIAKNNNIYRGKKLEFNGQLRFLNLRGRSWNTVILEEDIKDEIKANTVEFLRQKQLWEQYGIPPKRGILLVGEPGTGKTIICKTLIAEAEGITCITTDAYSLGATEYITELYELAQDLSPCLVFIEDIDLIGQKREEFGYQTGEALISLLAVLDGIEEKTEIVTVATTNSLETLDKALSERPSRFDRIIKLSRPMFDHRKELIHRLCQKIPLSEPIQTHIAYKTDGCTPAQIQEILYSVVIEHSREINDLSGANLNNDDIDKIISKISLKNKRRVGFCKESSYNKAG